VLCRVEEIRAFFITVFIGIFVGIFVMIQIEGNVLPKIVFRCRSFIYWGLE
jgi:hypothetical protein